MAEGKRLVPFGTEATWWGPDSSPQAPADRCCSECHEFSEKTPH